MLPEIYQTIREWGSFGVIVVLVVWFMLRAFPKMLDTVGTSVERVLNKIDHLEEACRQERREMFALFQAERAADRKAREEADTADRTARHEQGRLFQQAIADFSEMLNRPRGRHNGG